MSGISCDDFPSSIPACIYLPEPISSASHLAKFEKSYLRKKTYCGFRLIYSFESLDETINSLILVISFIYGQKDGPNHVKRSYTDKKMILQKI